MDIKFDKDGFLFFCKTLFLIGAVFFLGKFASQEYIKFTASNNPESAPQAVLNPRNFEQDEAPHEEYQKLASTQGIFTASEEVLRKSRELAERGEGFIFVDLDEMRIAVLEGEKEIASFPVMAKGKERSFFETPSGIYKIGYKETNHFSSIGKVWMPYSMHIFGNYFIHGWPYYPGGKPVEAEFSGGCIRLSREDSKELFLLAREDMPVLIYSKNDSSPALAENYYFKKIASLQSARPLNISAESAIAADFETGQVLFSKNQNSPHPIASVSKLMTALVASETMQARVFRVSKAALEAYGESAGLVEGEIFESDDLLYPLLLSSSNDAARIFEIEGWNFMRSMNQKASALGMRSTYFEDASGLDQRNVSTAEDIFRLLQYIRHNKKPIFDILSLEKYSLSSANNKKRHTWTNVNWPKDDKRFVSGKSGYTDEALQAMAGVYKVKLSEGEPREIAIIVLRSQDRVADIDKIIKNLEETVIYGDILVKNEPDSEDIPKRIIFNEANVFEAVNR